MPEPFLCKKGRRADGSVRYAIVIRENAKQRTLVTLPSLKHLVKLLRPEDNEDKVTLANKGTPKQKYALSSLTEPTEKEINETLKEVKK